MVEMDNLQKIKTSVLLQLFKQETSEPQYYAVEGLSNESFRITCVWQYTTDIERVRNEMRLALSLVSTIPTEDFFDTHGTKPEDYILYHYGCFLDLTHQLKDKIGHLCDSLTTSGVYVEKTKLKVSNLIKKDEIKKMIGLCDELKKWNQEAENQIAWSLGKRTRHHHYRSKLTSNSNLNKLSMYRAFQINPATEGTLTEYGKKVINESGITGLNGWQQEVKDNIEQTIKFAEESLEEISRILFENCNFPRVEESAEIVDNHFKMVDSLKIENLTSKKKISSEFEPIVELIENVIPQVLRGNLASLYIIGSIPRGEAVPGYSDLNIVVVVRTGDDSSSIVQGMKDSVEKFKNNIEILETTFDMIVLTQEDFLSKRKKKLRFICKNDGLLLRGKDLIRKEEFPKPGSRLAFLLNSDVREKISEYLKIISENRNLSQSKINKIGCEVSRMGLRVIFSGIISERALFERNLEKIKSIIDERYPQNAIFTQTLYNVATRKVLIDIDSLTVLLENDFGENGILANILGRIEEENEKLGKRKKV